jgi:protoporphyrinogen oxidase
MRHSCVVVGAGPSGLVTAWKLKQLGIKATVLEASPWVGGRTRSVNIDGATLNTGAAFFASFYSETLHLCREVGIELVRPYIHPGRAGSLRQMATADATLPYSPGTIKGFLGFPLVPLSAKIKFLALLARLTVGQRLHISDPESLVALDEGDASTWARHVVGDAAYHYFVRPAIEPFFYMGAEEVSTAVAKALLRHAVSWSLWTPRQGMGSFCVALSKLVDCRVNSRVNRIESAGSSLRVHYGSERIDADAVVLAIPAPAIAQFDAPLLDEDRRELSEIRFESNVAVFLGYSSRLKLKSPSVMAGGTGRHALVGITALSQAGVPGLIPSGKEVVVVLTMGWRGRELIGRSEDHVVDELVKEAKALGVDLPKPDWSFVCARREATVIPEPGYFRRIVAFAARRRSGIHYAGDWLTGSSTVEGAVRSGNKAARHVLEDLKSRS